MTTTPRKRVPASAPKPQDHLKAKSAAARKAEADGFVLIEQCGVKLKLPTGGNMPLDAVLLFQCDEETLREYGVDDADADDVKQAKINLAATKLMLGPEQWAEFRKKRPTIDDFNAIGEQLEALSGN